MIFGRLVSISPEFKVEMRSWMQRMNTAASITVLALRSPFSPLSPVSLIIQITGKTKNSQVHPGFGNTKKGAITPSSTTSSQSPTLVKCLANAGLSSFIILFLVSFLGSNPVILLLTTQYYANNPVQIIICHRCT